MYAFRHTELTLPPAGTVPHLMPILQITQKGQASFQKPAPPKLILFPLLN